MKKLFLFLVLILLKTLSFGQTQMQMNQTAANAYKKADKELNVAYKTILNLYKTDSIFIQSFKESQRLWVKFRDAELKMKYPETEPGFYGSVLPMCQSDYLEKLTLDRVKTLQIWIKGVEEGDVCSGSIRIKD